MEPITIFLGVFVLVLVSAGAFLGHTYLSRTPVKEEFAASRTAAALSDRIDAMDSKVAQAIAASQTAEATADNALAVSKKARDSTNGQIGALTKKHSELESQFYQLVTALSVPQQEQAPAAPNQGSLAFDPETQVR